MLSDYIARTEVSFDLPSALESLQEILAKYPFTFDRRQISLVHRTETDQSILDGVGSLYDFENRKWNARENDFRFFNEEFKDTYFHEIFTRMQEYTGGKIRRFRLMNIPPKTCYSMHQDPTVRYHLVLRTNEQAFFVFQKLGAFFLPADQHIYWVNTRHFHTAMNGGQEDRVHLVMSEGEG